MANSVVIPVIIDDKGGVTLGKIAQGLDNVGKKAKEAQGFMSEFSKSLSSGVGLGAGFTLGAAAANKMLEVVRSIPAEFSRLVEAASKISDLAARSGVATDALQELQYAGSLVGVSLESAAAGITKMQRALVDTPEKFRALGLSAQELIQMDPGQAFDEIALSIGAIANPTERAAAAMQVFGRSGAELLPLISSLTAARAEAKLLGTTLSEDTIGALDSMGDSTTRAGAAWDALKSRFAAAAVEALGLDRVMDGLAVTIGGLNNGAGGGFQGAADAMVAFMSRINPLTASVLALTDALSRQSAELYRVATAAKAGASAYSAGIFKPDVGLPGPQGAAALDMLTDQLKESSTETAKLAKENEKLAKAEKEAAAQAAILDRNLAALQHLQDASNAGDGRMFPGMPDAGINPFGGASGNYDPNAGSMEEFIAKQKAAQAAANEAAQKTAEDWGDVADTLSDVGYLIDNIGSLFSALGFTAESTAGKIVGAFSAAAKAAAGVAGALASGNIVGAIGAGIGGIAGIFSSIFGGGKKKREEEAARAKAEHDHAMQSAQDIVELGKKLEELRKQFVSKAADSMTQMFQGFSSSADQSQEHLDRLSRMGAAAFDNLRKHGYSVVEALDAMKPAIDAAIEAAKKSGKALTGPMKALADFQRKVEKNRATVDAATAMGDVIAGARAAGSFDQKSAQDAADEIKQLMKDMQKEGFTTSQALALIAPALYQIQQAAAAGQITIDAETQALIDQAQAGGMFDGLVDPMAQLVEIQQAMLELWIEIAKVLGAAVPAAAAKAAAAIGNIPAPPTGTPPPPGGADTGQDAGDGRRNPQRHATGGVARYTGWHILEQGERVLTPAQTRQWDHRGYGYEQGGVAGGGGGVAIHVGGIAIHGSADPKATAEAVAKELERRTAPRLRSAVRRAAAGRS